LSKCAIRKGPSVAWCPRRAGCTLSGNFANDLGGGIFNSSGDATIQSSTLSGNSAGTATSGGDGGAINNNAQGTMKIVGCTLSGNVANDSGGAILNYGTLTVSGCTLSSNSAVYYGGGIANVGNGTATVESSTVSRNVAGHGGGGGAEPFLLRGVAAHVRRHDQRHTLARRELIVQSA
jgi:hypothetical protein